MLGQLVSGDLGVSREFPRRFRMESNPVLEREGTRTVAELQAAALQVQVRAARAAARSARGRQMAARASVEAAAREQHLTALAAWQEQA